MEQVSPDEFGVPAANLLLVKGIVFDVIAQVVLMQVHIVFFTAVSGIGNDNFRKLLEVRSDPFQVRDQAGCISGSLMNTEPHHELPFGADLPQ